MFPDFFGAPPGVNGDVQVFNGGPTFQTWTKPRGCTMAFMLAIGAGAGGGGGHTAATATVRTGGGGGGGGASARLLIPMMFVPGTLYVQVGRGGAGGAVTSIGGSGALTSISIAPNLTQANSLLRSGTSQATGGGAGFTTAAVGGAAETIGTVTVAPLSQMGLVQFVAGKIGAAGGVVGGGTGAANTIASAYQLSGGGAGGGSTPAANTEFAGGAQIGAGIWPSVAGGVAAGGKGQSAPSHDPFMGYGGSGGGTGGAGAAGNGGKGGIGCGGGGGGGGITGGVGGAGGDGLVVIICW